MMLTDIKCRAADSWIRDVVLNHAESTWALTTTVEPDLPPSLKNEVTAVMMQEVAMVASEGITPDPEAMKAREAELHQEVSARVNEMAQERCKLALDLVSPCSAVFCILKPAKCRCVGNIKLAQCRILAFESGLKGVNYLKEHEVICYHPDFRLCCHLPILYILTIDAVVQAT